MMNAGASRTSEIDARCSTAAENESASARMRGASVGCSLDELMWEIGPGSEPYQASLASSAKSAANTQNNKPSVASRLRLILNDPLTARV